MLVVFSAPAVADIDAVNNPVRYSVQKVANQYYSEQSDPYQSNPWALPQEPEPPAEFQPAPKYYGQPDPVDRAAEQNKSQQYHQRRFGGRFVTPEFLDSLKKQQQHYQLMPENQRYHQHELRQDTMLSPGSVLPGMGAYGYPMYGAGSVNPLYDAPVVSPWAGGPDLLYHGESFPVVPNEAIGGLPPIPLSPFGSYDSSKRESEGSGDVENGKVFNPFTFLPR